MLRSIHTEVNYCLTEDLMHELSGKNDPSALMAVIEMREDSLESVKLSDVPFIVLFDRPSNKGNLGTIIRSCDALGADILILTGHAVDLYDPDVVVSSMGSFFRFPVVRVSDNRLLYTYIDQLKKRYNTFITIGTTAHKKQPVYTLDLTKPLLLMLGNETMGLSSEYKSFCDVRARFRCAKNPMPRPSTSAAQRLS